ncbi:MAG: AAA family ATPase [Polyangiaceae bacterium]|nr:AAA family ATPase [Polyangiaceae bacterium]
MASTFLLSTLLLLGGWSMIIVHHQRSFGGNVDPSEARMRIPYGMSNFAAIRREKYFYADKTPFIPYLEAPEGGAKHVIFLRPRRFGKSTLVSMLEYYYDREQANAWDELFGGLWVHEHPTPERGQYLVLTLDFSPVNTDGEAADIQRSFTTIIKAQLMAFLTRHSRDVPKFAHLRSTLDSYFDAASLLSTVIAIVHESERKLYVLIDEYDHFANRLLSDGNQALYEAIVRGTGFVRSFYSALKAGTRTGALARMFITGVSPILLDDLSSGFNIITHVSLLEQYNSMAGFTRADVERAVDEFLLGKPHLTADPRLGDRSALLTTIERYYNGYRFSKHATERVYNSDLVLYFLSRIAMTGRYPEQMLDLNVRTDYGRLQRIARLAEASGSDTRVLLESILSEDSVSSPLVEQFGARNMDGRAQLVSLFYYMGMLTFGAGSEWSADPVLVVPNRVIRELQWEYLAFAIQDQEQIFIDTYELSKALAVMASKGEVEPLLTLFREQVVARIGNKDLRQFNEKVLKLMLLAYICQSRWFHVLSEKEFSGGYADLFLGLNPDVPAGKFAWMFEVKYLQTKAKKADIEHAFEQAFTQLQRYTSDTALVSLLTLGKELKVGALVFVGSKDVLYRAWPAVEPAKKKTPTPAQASKRAEKATRRRRR